MSRTLPSLLLALLCAGCAGDTWDTDPPSAQPLGDLTATIVVHGSRGKASVTAVVRATASERAVGLMYRKEPLGDSTGMLFIMDDDSDHSFWMKNTYISLDMLFIDAHGNIVGVVEETEPLSRTSRKSGKPSRYVLEVDAGWARRHGVFAGQTAEISL